MAKQKPKRRKKSRRGRGRPGRDRTTAVDGGSGGGAMQSMLGGFRRATGAEAGKSGKKSNLIGNLIWVALIAAATAVVVSRYSN
ncbi:MAG: hypothetical protein JRH11_05215 [Deltaproteobacteria bacterium]|nr:hypothetical protein [Deltaproteobacteria bacterium]